MPSSRAVYISVGRRVRQERLRRGWTQEDLAEKAGLHLSFIGQIERGVKAVSLQTLKRIADIFGLRAAQLLDESRPVEECPYPIEKKVASLIAEHTPDQQRMLLEALKHLSRQARRLGRASK